LCALLVVLTGLASYHASKAAGITREEWAAGLSMILAHLAIDRMFPHH